jgi:hypothetical protein
MAAGRHTWLLVVLLLLLVLLLLVLLPLLPLLLLRRSITWHPLLRRSCC